MEWMVLISFCLFTKIYFCERRDDARLTLFERENIWSLLFLVMAMKLKVPFSEIQKKKSEVSCGDNRGDRGQGSAARNPNRVHCCL